MKVATLKGRLERLKALADIVDEDGYGERLADILNGLQLLDGHCEVKERLLARLRDQLLSEKVPPN